MDDWFSRQSAFLAEAHLKTAKKWIPASIKSTNLNNHHCQWMYNNIPGAFRESWLDIYSWTIEKLDNPRVTTSLKDATNLLDKSLLEISKLGTLGFLYSYHQDYNLVISRCRALDIDYIEYYMHLDVFDYVNNLPSNIKLIFGDNKFRKIHLRPDVKLLPTITEDIFVEYIKYWVRVTLSTNVHHAYTSYVVDQHNGPFLTPNLPSLINLHSVDTHFTGPPYWGMALDEDDWAVARWGKHTGKDIINPFLWNSQLIRAWLTLPEIVDFIHNYKCEGVPIRSSKRIVSLLLPKTVELYKGGNTVWPRSIILEWKTLMEKEMYELTGENNKANCIWPLHRMADHLNMTEYFYLNDAAIKKFGEVL